MLDENDSAVGISCRKTGFEMRMLRTKHGSKPSSVLLPGEKDLTSTIVVTEAVGMAAVARAFFPRSRRRLDTGY